MGKRETVIELVEAGQSTKEQILEAIAPTDSKGLASIFTTLRLMGKYPVAGEDGKFVFVSAEEYEAAKASRASAGPRAAAKSPEERLEAAQKRVTKSEAQHIAAQSRLDLDPKNKEFKLRLQRAKIEAEIAALELEKVQASMPVEEATAGDEGFE